MQVFGPVPSRRFGNSLGINNLPPKVCSYSCIYCQVGCTDHLRIERETFYPPGDIIQQVRLKLREVWKQSEKVDFLTFVPDGEPTLDRNLGKMIKALKTFEIKIAVITNASLLYLEEVRGALSHADAVSLKIDSVTKDQWRSINRPHGRLMLQEILDGIRVFSDFFDGSLLTETMLIKNQNDDSRGLNETARFISDLDIDRAYIAIPVRPPAEASVEPADSAAVNRAHQIFKDRNAPAALMIEPEQGFFFSGDETLRDILNIASVHPLRDEVLEQILNRRNLTREPVQRLIDEGYLKRIRYNGITFYLRNFGYDSTHS